MWSNDIKQSIIAANGSVQHLQLPDDIKAMYARPLSCITTRPFHDAQLHFRYKTAWEIKQRSVIDMAADRCGTTRYERCIGIRSSSTSTALLF
jgi:hypothetical protein